MPRKEPMPLRESFVFEWQVQTKKSVEKSPKVEAVFNARRAFRESKLFCSKGRVTLTFYYGNEVSSIHFDRQKREIFYKGRNIRELSLQNCEYNFLKAFVDYLDQQNLEEKIGVEYQNCLREILERQYVFPFYDTSGKL